MKMSKAIQRRRRLPDEIPTPKAAIRNHCLECVGYVVQEVELCTAPQCWLFPWRLGKTPEGVRRKNTVNNLPKRHVPPDA